MRHRLYYVFPDVRSARLAFDELLLDRITERHIRFLTKGPKLPLDMPEATIFQKTDVIHGAESGMAIGAALGGALGLWLVYFPLDEITVSYKAAVVVLATLCAAFVGGWASSLVAAALPNSRLQRFDVELEEGKILMMVDVPARRLTYIEKRMAARHPEIRFGGEEAHMPIFP